MKQKLNIETNCERKNRY